MHYIMSFGGGLTSFFAAIEAIARYGAENVTVVNAALWDDEQYVKPVIDAFTAHTGVPVVRVSAINPALDVARAHLHHAEAGRVSPRGLYYAIAQAKARGMSRWSTEEVDAPRYGVWDVFFLTRIIGSTHADPCSDQLKRQVLRRWVEVNHAPGAAAIALGMTADEIDRHMGALRIWKTRGYDVVSPLMDTNYNAADARQRFIDIAGFLPEAYTLGMDHNNCDLCVKAGQAHFARCLYYRPQQYARWSKLEALHQRTYQHEFTILRDRAGGVSAPLSLAAFAERMQARWASTQVLPGMEHLMFFGLDETPACTYCDSAA